MIKVALAGAKGRMGKEIIQLLNEDKDVELTATIERDQNTKDIFDGLSINNKPNVLIDFSVKEALENHIQLCLKNKIAFVTGITGFSEKEKQILLAAANTIPIVYASNMSIGVNLCYELLDILGNRLKDKHEMSRNITTSIDSKNDIKDSNDIAIHETHHKLKKDAPSGTALKMQEILAKASGKDKTFISVTSHRLGENPGEHKIVFALSGEQIEITHKANNRSIFARGAILAAKWIVGKTPGLYDMQDVLS